MLGHPKGLFILFMTEMWERFSFYGMKAILTLFLVSNVNGGFGWEKSQALELYGWYGMLVYVMSIPGGIIADKFLGQKKSVMVGGFLLCAGHLLMAFPGLMTFYVALGLIIAGVGMLKPNISTMVGGLYGEKDPKRDEGFTYFYMGINLGAFLATMIVGYVGEKIGWHYGFGLAGIGMLIGQITFLYGQKHLTTVGNLVKKEDIKVEKREPLTKVEKDRLILVGISFFIVLIFWMAFEQAGGFMTLYTDEYTDRSFLGLFEVPASIVQGLNPLYIILFGPVVAAYWYKRSLSGKKSSAIFKMSMGTIIMGLGFLFMVAASMQKDVGVDGTVIQKSSLYWLAFAYLFHTIGELCLSPVALSFITKLSPPHLVARVMGLYFAVTGFSNYLASKVGQQAEKFGDLAVFAGLAGFSILVGLAFIIFDNKLTSMSHGVDETAKKDIVKETA